MTIYAIDPGTEQSAIVELHDAGAAGWILSNAALLEQLTTGSGRKGHLVIEQIECYGLPVGRETFDTVFWSARFAQAWEAQGGSWSLLPRRAVKLELCGTARAKDPHVRQALIDRFGGKGCTKKGGALHGIVSHMWSALAIGVTYQALAVQARREAV